MTDTLTQNDINHDHGHDLVDSIYELAMSTATEIGEAYMSSLIRCLHDVMPVSLAFVAQATGDPATQVSAKYSWFDGKVGVPIEYELEGTPCKFLYEGQTLLIPHQLVEKFPDKDKFESYCGVPLMGRDGTVKGHFAVFSTEVIENPQKVEGIVRVFGMRAAAELQRMEYEAEKDAIIRRLDQQRRALHEANTFKTSALGMVAHDLRNPLSAIMGRADLIDAILGTTSQKETEATAERIRKSLEAIFSAADRMNSMIGNLLDTARVELGNMEIRPSPILLSTITSAAVGLVANDAEKKNITLHLENRSDAEVAADEARLTEAIVNLLTNAVKYSPPRTNVVVAVDVMKSDASAVIIVQDEGLGMNEHDLILAFRPFQTLSAKPTAGEQSTGLGLAIVKSVVEAHGGTITVASDGPEKGTTFTITLPT